ncbi:MAG: 1-(5-phosphoribosyl)-5-[(5-phosphoribosylamino)methylideneamino]imidazole-4-carboxamide isomerase [Spirochaetaceae bacterium]|nr:1-(5-phosphoribosyl)-5-[(5-phosphoribosylamino)methylideneamino]imidazole-4-carboxamide isomerase [Spirochaetaceae bacterium]
MIIIPAIDIFEGNLVRLNQGDYNSVKQYGLSPLDIAKSFEDAGLTHLHLVDLEGAKSGEPKNLKILEKICSNTNLIVDFGGGVKSTASLKDAFNSGASRITCGSIAVKNRALVLEWLEKYGESKLVLGADCKNNMIATGGWLEESDLEIHQFITSFLDKGFKRVVATDISKDGMLKGPSFDLYKSLITTCNNNLELVASGGVSCSEDLTNLSKINCYGAIVGKAFYEGRISLKELSILEETLNVS